MTKEERIDRLTKIGGKRWQKNEKDRIYFNQLDRYLPEFTFGLYGTGNVSSAQLDGDTVSNSKATGLINALAHGKFWWDVTEQKFHWTLGDCRLMSGHDLGMRILGTIKRESGYESIAV